MWAWDCIKSRINLVRNDTYIFKIMYLFMACGTLVPQPGTEPRSLAVEARSLNHWTTREVPEMIFFHKSLPTHEWVPSLHLFRSSLVSCGNVS